MGLQLELPVEDNELSGEEGHVFISENHLFDFSTVDTLPLEEFRRIAEDPDICPPSIKIANKRGYMLNGERTTIPWGGQSLFSYGLNSSPEMQAVPRKGSIYV